MIRASRTFGQNLCYFLKKKNIDESVFAQRIGYSLRDLKQVMDARLFIPKREKNMIAEVLGVPLEKLLQERKDSLIAECSPLIECRGYFSSEESKNKILDLFDAYCDIQELIERERPSV